MKIFITAILIIFIIAVFLFIVIRYNSNSADTDNWFNNNYRAVFARFPLLRSIFNLRWDGDAKTDYLLSDKYTSLKIEVDQYENCQLNEKMMIKVQAELEKVVDKPLGISVSYGDTLPLVRDSYSSDEIRLIADKYQNDSVDGSQAVLYVLCLNSYEEVPSYIGLTVHEDGVVIFWDTIKQLNIGSSANSEDYIISTILHEFGHQLGVGHINNSRCIMAESVEAPSLYPSALNKISTRYCSQELQMVEDIKNAISRPD